MIVVALELPKLNVIDSVPVGKVTVCEAPEDRVPCHCWLPLALTAIQAVASAPSLMVVLAFEPVNS